MKIAEDEEVIFFMNSREIYKINKQEKGTVSQ